MAWSTCIRNTEFVYPPVLLRSEANFIQALPWKTVVAGAIRVARDGFVGKFTQGCNAVAPTNTMTVSKDLVRKMNDEVSGNRTYLVEDPNWALDFAPNGTSYLKLIYANVLTLF